MTNHILVLATIVQSLAALVLARDLVSGLATIVDINYSGECPSVQDYNNLVWTACQRYDGKKVTPTWTFVKKQIGDRYGKITSTLCNAAGTDTEYCWTAASTGEGLVAAVECRDGHRRQDFSITGDTIWSMTNTGEHIEPTHCVIHEPGQSVKTKECHHTNLHIGHHEKEQQLSACQSKRLELVQNKALCLPLCDENGLWEEIQHDDIRGYYCVETHTGLPKHGFSYSNVTRACESKCPPNQKYDNCHTACPRTCDNYKTPTPCNKKCKRGCDCAPGFVRETEKSDKCIPECDCERSVGTTTPNVDVSTATVSASTTGTRITFPATTVVRLVPLYPGFRDDIGRVEVFYDGQWGSICNAVIDGNDNGATVICRMLGYAGGSMLPFSSYAWISPLILLNDVECIGNEESIFDCARTDSSDCGLHEGISVQCYMDSAPTTVPVTTVGEVTTAQTRNVSMPSNCVDFPHWQDMYGSTCDWYTHLTCTYQMGIIIHAAEACCVCGGGTTTVSASSSGPSISNQEPGGKSTSNHQSRQMPPNIE